MWNWCTSILTLNLDLILKRFRFDFSFYSLISGDELVCCPYIVDTQNGSTYISIVNLYIYVQADKNKY